MHETAQDYNFVSRKLKESYGGDVFMYGSSYGATLAYSSFKFDTKLVMLHDVSFAFVNFVVCGSFVGSFCTGISVEWRC
jgi:hypothetical protein